MKKGDIIIGLGIVLVCIGTGSILRTYMTAPTPDLATQIINEQAEVQAEVDKANAKILPKNQDIAKKLNLLNVLDHKKANQVILTCFPQRPLFPDSRLTTPPSVVKTTTK
jgi:hypothetical protein